MTDRSGVWRDRLLLWAKAYGLLLLLLVVGGCLRFFWNDVPVYSPADESFYVSSTRYLLLEAFSAYHKLVDAHLTRQDLWLSPTPLRYGYFALTTLTCSAHSPCDARALAWLSTIAGVASIGFTYLLGARLVGKKAGLLAAALTVTSPLQLALGRRALGDEVFCAIFLATFWALVRLVQEDGQDKRSFWRKASLFIGCATLAFSVKETFVFPYAGLVAIALLAPNRPLRFPDALVLAAPPALFFLGFVLVGKSPAAFFELLKIGRASFFSDYAAGYEAGPAHRPLFDLFVLAPVVCLLASFALARVVEGRKDAGGERWLALFGVIALVAFMGLPKNLRFVVILDPILRLLAAWALVTIPWGGRERGPRWLGAAAFVNAAPELMLFHATFIAGGTYDPTTYDVLRALGAVPRPGARVEPSAWPIVFFAAFALAMVALFVARRRLASANGAEIGAETQAASKAVDVDAKGRERGALLAIGAFVVVIAALVWSSMSSDERAPVATNTPVRTNVQAPATGAVPAETLMAQGIEALYQKNDPTTAAARFRDVLAQAPEHYGATFQLASALDRMGKPGEARPLWTKMLGMAEASGDAKTLEKARARLAQMP